SSWSKQIPVCLHAFGTEFRLHGQNSARENAMCRPGLLCGPAPSLQVSSFLPRLGIFRYPTLSPRIQESRNVPARTFRIRRASASFLLALLLPFRERYGLPATEIRSCAETTASAFPSARYCTTG